jgi:hypothetical protein
MRSSLLRRLLIGRRLPWVGRGGGVHFAVSIGDVNDSGMAMVVWRLSFSMDWAAMFVFVSAAGAGDGEARLIMICGWDGGGGGLRTCILE